MRVLSLVCVILAGVFLSSDAFTFNAPVRRRASSSKMTMNAEAVLKKVEEKKLLSQVASLGVLSKAEEAGFTPADLEPLLVAADEAGVVAILPDLLENPLLPGLIDFAPSALPLAASLLKTPPILLVGAAFASFGAAAAEVYLIPDDSVGSVALQTFLAIPLGAILPAVSLGGAFVLGYRK